MSKSAENHKENKKPKGKEGKEKKQSKSQWKPVTENPKKLPEGIPLKMSRSPKLKKKSSADQVNSEQCSETVELTGYDDEKSESMSIQLAFSPSKNALPMPTNIIEAAPPTHFVTVFVSLGQTEAMDFKKGVKYNKNMVITKVPITFMTVFMPGDQIAGVNGTSVWNGDDLMHELSVNQKISVEISLVRVWNIKCLSKDQMEQIFTQIEVGRQYFVVNMFCENDTGGIQLAATWKSVTVHNIRANTPVSKVLLSGDEILAVDNQLLSGINKKVMIKQAYRLIRDGAEKHGYVEIIASRRVGARSSPAPSLEAELGKEFSGYAVGVPKGGKAVPKDPAQLIDLPFAADSLEIALRELTFLQQWVKPDLEQNPCDKGEPLLMERDSRPTKSRMLPVLASSSSNNTSPCNSTAHTPRDSQALPPTSMAQPVIEMGGPSKTVMLPPVPLLLPNSSQKSMKTEEVVETKTGLVKFNDKYEKSHITSDIPEGEELKKCHERAGIVNYIKNKYASNKPPSSDNQAKKK